jgi:hypothetical protein
MKMKNKILQILGNDLKHFAILVGGLAVVGCLLFSAIFIFIRATVPCRSIQPVEMVSYILTGCIFVGGIVYWIKSIIKRARIYS